VHGPELCTELIRQPNGFMERLGIGGLAGNRDGDLPDRREGPGHSGSFWWWYGLGTQYKARIAQEPVG
jgi:hypothetical protein